MKPIKIQSLVIASLFSCWQVSQAQEARVATSTLSESVVVAGDCDDADRSCSGSVDQDCDGIVSTCASGSDQDCDDADRVCSGGIDDDCDGIDAACTQVSTTDCDDAATCVSSSSSVMSTTAAPVSTSTSVSVSLPSSTSTPSSPPVAEPAGMAINEKGLPGAKSKPKSTR